MANSSESLESSFGTVGLPEERRTLSWYTNLTLALSGRMGGWGGSKTAGAGCIRGIFLSLLHKGVLRNNLKLFVDCGVRRNFSERTSAGIFLESYCCC